MCTDNIADPLGIDPVGKALGENVPELQMMNDAVETGNWFDPYGSEKSALDVLGAGPAAQITSGGKPVGGVLDPNDPGDRKIGRTIGTAIGASFIPVPGAEAGAGAMPAATPELAAANAVPGGVTASSGMGNAVTQGLAGTSGVSGLAVGGGGGAAPGGEESILPTEPTKPTASSQAAPTGPASPEAPSPSPATPAGTGTDVFTGGPAAAASSPSPAAATPAPAAQPSLSSRAMAALTKDPLTTAALGMNVIGQVNARKDKRDAESQLREQGRPAREAGEELLRQGRSGVLPPAIMAQFDDSLMKRVAEIEQRYRNSGRDPKTDSSAQSEIARAISQRDQQVAAYSQSLIDQGLRALGVASGPQTAAINAGVQADKDLQGAMGGTLESMAKLEALRAKQQPAAAAK